MIKKLPTYYNPSAFPDFQSGHILPPKFTSAKVKSPELRECLSAVVYLASQIDLTDGSLHLRKEKIQNIYFRAAIAELIRIEDITEQQGNKFTFNKTDDPLLHVVKLIRNYQVHIAGILLSGGAIAVIWAGNQGIYESSIVDNLNVQELRKLNSASSYTDDQLKELIVLFNINQRKFGVVQLLYNTCIHVARCIVQA
jgi:hypothetical protein